LALEGAWRRRVISRSGRTSKTEFHTDSRLRARSPKLFRWAETRIELHTANFLKAKLGEVLVGGGRQKVNHLQILLAGGAQDRLDKPSAEPLASSLWLDGHRSQQSDAIINLEACGADEAALIILTDRYQKIGKMLLNPGMGKLRSLEQLENLGQLLLFGSSNDYAHAATWQGRIRPPCLEVGPTLSDIDRLDSFSVE
jgi:hypothetical protein